MAETSIRKVEEEATLIEFIRFDVLIWIVDLYSLLSIQINIGENVPRLFCHSGAFSAM